MNLVLLHDEDFESESAAVLRDRRARHVREVHRAKVGDTLVVGRLGGRIGEGRVAELTADAVRLEVSLDGDPPPPSRIDLLLALPRPKVLRRVLATVATLGIKRVVLVNAWRVEKAYFSSPQLAPGAIREELLLGLEQARDTILPEVHLRALLMPFLDEELDTFWPGTRRIVAHPTGGPIEGCDAGAPTDPAVMAIGPEGGWIQREVDTLLARGFHPVALGPRILRVETAVSHLHAQLELLRRGARSPSDA